HFEKMLYDNGPLLRLYADAWLVTGEPLFKIVCEETARWVMREMQSHEGGYYSSLDADSEHEEGKFYVWSREEFAALLTEDEYEIAAAYFGLDRAPNFEDHAWNPYVAQAMESIAVKADRDLQACKSLLHSARVRLLAAREKRVRPGRDEKILTGWNALMIDGMAHAARVFGRDDWHLSARRAMDFVTTKMWKQGRLLATCKDARAHLNGYLDDYAFLLAASLEMLQAEFATGDLQLASALADTLIERFEDQAAGGFYFTSDDHEALILRPKPGADNATPSGNGIAALALTRLGHLLGESHYLRAADRAVRIFFPAMLRQPGGFSTLCIALGEVLEPGRVIVLRGPRDALRPWQQTLAGRYLPDAMTMAIDSATSGLPGALNKPVVAAVNAYVCRGVTCLAPVEDIRDLVANLDAG
ncbi:MAG: thioredoxin domain-containing protein, partial [Betaproteobacteria bacterium]